MPTIMLTHTQYFLDAQPVETMYFQKMFFKCVPRMSLEDLSEVGETFSIPVFIKVDSRTNAL